MKPRFVNKKDRIVKNIINIMPVDIDRVEASLLGNSINEIERYVDDVVMK